MVWFFFFLAVKDNAVPTHSLCLGHLLVDGDDYLGKVRWSVAQLLHSLLNLYANVLYQSLTSEGEIGDTV